MPIIMQIEVQVCDSTDPHANQIFDGVFRATPGALLALRSHKKVKIDQSAVMINLAPKDYVGF